MAGCACTANSTLTPSASPSLEPTAAVTPTEEVGAGMTGTEGTLTPSPDGTATGDGTVTTDPNGAGTAEGANAAGTSGAAGTGTGTIANFKEGTEVQAADVPQVQTAVSGKYENAQIKAVRHAMYEGKQVYEVDIVSGTTTKTVYVTPDGTVTEKAS